MENFRPTAVYLDFDRLAYNYRLLTQRARGPILAVVKANAYGHGVAHIAPFLQWLGVKMFGVALIEEGIALRQMGITGDIIVMSSHFRGAAQTMRALNLTPLIGNFEDLAAFEKLPGPMHLEFDTGIHRNGFVESEWPALYEWIQSHPQCEIKGVASHFACADEPDHAWNYTQITRFGRVLSHLKKINAMPPLIHMSNSAALLSPLDARFNCYRLGLALYGYAPPGNSALPLLPVLSVRTKVSMARVVGGREVISYGASYITPHRSRIATLPIGYADGYMRSLSNRAHVLIMGQPAPVVGRVCMDLMMCEVSKFKEMPNDQEVVVLGDQADSKGRVSRIDAQMLAEFAGTIPYEILTGLSARLPRVTEGRYATVYGVPGSTAAEASPCVK